MIRAAVGFTLMTMRGEVNEDGRLNHSYKNSYNDMILTKDFPMYRMFIVFTTAVGRFYICCTIALHPYMEVH